MNLMKHQDLAADFLAARPAALLADGMRVGKTPAAIGGADRIGARNILWLTRGAARVEHARAWSNFQTIDRPIQILESRLQSPAAGVNIVSYDLAAAGLYDKLLRPYDLIVLDESHRLKTRDAKRTKAIFGEKCHRKGCLAELSPVVWCLSGTPAPNHPAELWPMLHAVLPQTIPQPQKPEVAMRYWSFVARYCKTEENYMGHLQITGGKNLKHLKQALEPFMLRRKIEDVMADVPRLTVDTLPLNGKLRLPAGAEADIERVNDALDRHGVAGLAKVEANAGTLRRLTGLAKVEPIVAWVAERLEENDEKIVLFAHHVEIVEMLMAGLKQFSPVALYGGASVAEKREAAPRFREDPSCRVFIGNLDSAGEAIDLSVADELVFVESAWTPGINQQAALRIVNLMKKRPTLARFATIPGSYDERIAEACARKLATITELFS